MSYFKNILIIFTILSLSTSQSNNNDKLLFVWQHFRHGARGAYKNFNYTDWNDFLGESWKGAGELSPIGMRMPYLLGVSTKKRYPDFLSKNYNPNEIFVISTDVNRTIMTATSYMQGLYNNETSQNLTNNQINNAKIKNSNYTEKINEKIKELNNKSLQGGINVFPHRIYPTSYGYQFQLYRSDSCPGIKKYVKEGRKTDEMEKLYNDVTKEANETFGENIFKFMNVTNDTNYLWNYTNLDSISDTFVADYTDGRVMNYIKSTGIDFDKFYNFSTYLVFIAGYYSQFGKTNFTKALYLGATPMFRSLFNYMEMRIELDKKNKSDLINASSPRFVVISGHDSSLASNDLFLYSEFGIPYEKAGYSSSEIYELWKNSTDGNYYLKLFVNEKEIKNFDYNNFKKKIEAKLYSQEDINYICGGEKNDSSNQNGKKNKSSGAKAIFIILIFLVVIFAILFIVFLLLTLKRKKYKSN